MDDDELDDDSWSWIPDISDAFQCCCDSGRCLKFAVYCCFHVCDVCCSCPHVSWGCSLLASVSKGKVALQRGDYLIPASSAPREKGAPKLFQGRSNGSHVRARSIHCISLCRAEACCSCHVRTRTEVATETQWRIRSKASKKKSQV